MSETLEYAGKQVVAEPINMSLDMAATYLRDARPCVVELEPGDVTYYNLLIVPAWRVGVGSYLQRFGIAPGRASEYLIVTKLTDVGGLTFFATREVGSWDLEIIPNEWTRELLAWWLRELWRRI